ncbi:MAG: ABC transporter permease [Gammaproteobacteria bacterium]
MKDLLRDIVFTLRRFVRRPGPALAIIGTLAVAIAANTAVFSAFNSLVLEKLPYDTDGTLVSLKQVQKLKGTDVPFSVKEAIDYRDQIRGVRDVVEYHTMTFTILGETESTKVQVGVVSNNFFSVLGVKPLLGRGFAPDDEVTGAEPVVLLSHDFWMRQFAGDKGIVNQSLRMNDKLHRVIGVLPQYVQFPGPNDLYMPTIGCPFRSSDRAINTREIRMVNLLGRLAPGTGLEAGAAEVSSVASRIHEANPQSYPAEAGFGSTLVSVQEETSRGARPTFVVLFAATLLVMVLACANVANLLVTQQLQRRKELTVRVAVGAARGRIVRMLLTESLLLTLVGGALGVILAHAALGELAQFASRFSQRATEIAIDGRVLAFAFGMSLLAGLAVGLLPALSRTSIVTALRESSDKSTAPEHRQRMRRILVASQIAITFVLLVSTGLMTRSILKLQARDLGFEPTDVSVAVLQWNWSKYPGLDQQHDFARRFEGAMSSLPGATSVALASSYPLDGLSETNPLERVDLHVQGATNAAGGSVTPVVVRQISASYFSTLHVSVMQGRAFTRDDDERAELVAVVNQKLADTYWPGGQAVAQFVSVDGGKTWRRVVGVVGNERRYGLAEDVKPQLYLPVVQSLTNIATLNALIRTNGATAQLEQGIRHAVHDLDPEQAVDKVVSLDQLLANAVSAPRVVAILLGSFGGAALLITLAGVAGVIAYSVSLRTREIGIRVALGAQRSEVVWMILRQGIVLTAGGLLFGYLASIVAGNLLAASLYQVGRFDLVTLLGVTVVVAAAAIIAAWIPARMASSVNPQIAIRAL